MSSVFQQHRRLITSACLTAVTGLVLGGCASGSTTRKTSAPATAVLSCADSAGQQGIDGAPAQLVNGVDGFIGDSNAYDQLPSWGKVAGHRYLAWKTGLAVAPDAHPYRTVSVLSPPAVRLVYGSHVKRPSTQIRLPSCGRRYTFFAGAILVMRPACVRLAVTGPAGRPVVVVVPVLVAHC